MKGSFNFPSELQLGPGSRSVRSLLLSWSKVDWFTPGAKGARQVMGLISQHHLLANQKQPQQCRVPSVHMLEGHWDEFAELCSIVRVCFGEAPIDWPQQRDAKLIRLGVHAPLQRESWDWKLGPLKTLSREHWRSQGWTPESCAHVVKELKPPHEGALFLRPEMVETSPIPGINHTMWNPPLPKLEYPHHMTAEQAALGDWYLHYATADVMEAAAWQLASGTNSLSGNPYVPLLECYSLGYLPFSLDPTNYVAFSFATPTGTQYDHA